MVNRSKTETQRSGETASPDRNVVEAEKSIPGKRRKNTGLIDGKYSIRDLIDLESLRDTLEKFSRATGVATGFCEYPSQKILFSTGWSDICSQFHRKHSLSEELCIKNNLQHTSQLSRQKPLNIYVCENGLVDGAAPVIIRGVHLASFIAGQVFFEKPDPEFFKMQAKKYGYNEEKYLEALRRVPVITEEQFRDVLAFLGRISVMCAELGLNSLRNLERNGTLKKKAAEIERTDKELRKLNRELEDQINKRIVMLEQSNRELEAFSYSISHDLRTPLRAINGFTHILLDDYGASLNDEVRKYLMKIQQGSIQMDSLINNLIEFSRLSRQSLNIQKVKPVQMVKAIIQELSEERKGRNIEFVINALPCCHGDPLLLRKVLYNILSNSLKFTRNCERAMIEIGSTVIEKATAYYVRDNGAGFDMRHAGRLFGLFQRLHNAGEFNGDGVGLAIAQRIVHRHNGQIWAESERGRGATFYFIIPRKSSL